jgi:hypothetical protein
MKIDITVTFDTNEHELVVTRAVPDETLRKANIPGRIAATELDRAWEEIRPQLVAFADTFREGWD